MWIFPLAAAGVSAVFASILFRGWRTRPRAHLLAWSVALAMFAVASGAAAIGMLAGWSGPIFRTYYLFGAILNVPVLALGTLYLLAPARHARVATSVVILLSLSAAIAVLGAPLDVAALRTTGIPSGGEVMPPGPRAVSRYYSFAGFFVVVGGALWSAGRLARSRQGHLKRLAVANGLIATGTFIVAVASGFARYGRGLIFAVGLFLGVSVMFLGFLMTRPRTS
ncbi:MAG: hypothetical protein GEU78_10550 [Actinobacteria bacterium]|nr:hypothetical protein [Actinomycetota bacterium]